MNQTVFTLNFQRIVLIKQILADKRCVAHIFKASILGYRFIFLIFHVKTQQFGKDFQHVSSIYLLIQSLEKKKYHPVYLFILK
jgi:hypothetical protein